MKITKSSVIGLMLGLSLVAACGRDSNNGNGGTPDAGGGGGGGGSDAGGGGGSDGGTIGGGVVTVKDIQSDAMPVKTAVELHGVVVIAIDSFGAKIGQDMWVQDPAGGARSGIHVFRPQTADIATLKPGDIVDIKGGVKSEFPTVTPLPNPSLTTVTELQAPSGGKLSITKTGTGAVPAAHLLDAAALEAMTDANARAKFLEDWEGVYVTLQNVRPNGQPTSYNTQSPAADTQVFDITSGLSVESNLAAFPASLDNSVCLASVTGVIDFVAGKYVIYPTKTAEIASGGTTCPAPTVFTPSTVAEVQNGTHTKNVKLTGVFVTAVNMFGGKLSKTIWVSDALTAAPGTGVEVFNARTIDAGAQVVGAKVDITGTVDEFNGGNTAANTLTELKDAVVTLTAAPGTLPTPAAVTVNQINSVTDAVSETYEGTLVKILNVKVTKAADTFDQVELTDATGLTIIMDDDVFSHYSGSDTEKPPALGTCFASVTGVMDVQVKTNVRTINPRLDADFEPNGTCAP